MIYSKEDLEKMSFEELTKLSNDLYAPIKNLELIGKEIRYRKAVIRLERELEQRKKELSENKWEESEPVYYWTGYNWKVD